MATVKIESNENESAWNRLRNMALELLEQNQGDLKKSVAQMVARIKSMRGRDKTECVDELIRRGASELVYSAEHNYRARVKRSEASEGVPTRYAVIGKLHRDGGNAAWRADAALGVLDTYTVNGKPLGMNTFAELREARYAAEQQRKGIDFVVRFYDKLLAFAKRDGDTVSTRVNDESARKAMEEARAEAEAAG